MMDWFDEILTDATGAIAREYFALPIHGEDDPVYRERVYCYELYHQLRSRWPADCPYSLCGEADKHNHPYYRRDHPKPDFIVHIPGQGDNYAAIEVKRPGAAADAIREDLRKLQLFRRPPAHYQRSIYLIYGVDPEQTIQRVAASAQDPARLHGVELWVQQDAYLAAERAVSWGTGPGSA